MGVDPEKLVVAGGKRAKGTRATVRDKMRAENEAARPKHAPARVLDLIDNTPRLVERRKVRACLPTGQGFAYPVNEFVLLPVLADGRMALGCEAGDYRLKTIYRTPSHK